ncbi:MAG: hypothetical protein AB7I25_04835 [Vicinamibacterales bacterium]
MVPLSALWLPVLLSAVLVFVASSVIHMLLRYHDADYQPVPGEDDVQAALRRFNLTPGDYMLPCAGGMKELQSQAFLDKMRRGPVVTMTVLENRPPALGANLAMWFVFALIVGVLCAYVAGLVLPVGVRYRLVFRVVSTVAFTAYAMALWQMSIWYRRAWGSTLRATLDGVIYALLTGGAFGWLWPR